jgi:hypothetical protein
MARAVDADRLAAAGEIMSILRGRPSVREAIAAHVSGERPILVASIDDPLQAVLDRIAATGSPLDLVRDGWVDEHDGHHRASGRPG